MKRLYYGWTAILLSFIFFLDSNAQTVGIGTDFPTATLDIVTTNIIPGARITRALTPTAAPAAAVEINDNSDWGALDVYYINSTGGFTGGYIQNETPGSIGLWTTNLNASSVSSGRFTQAGSGIGVEIAMLDVGNFGTALDVFHIGGGNGIILDMFSGTSAAYAQAIINYSNTQGGLLIDNTLTSAIGIVNLMEDAFAVANIHFSPAPWISGQPGGSFYTDLSLFPGLAGVSSNVGYIANMDGSDGIGYLTFNNDNENGGDGYGYYGFVETLTPDGGGLTYGTLFGGEQNGVGHGIIINHDGSQGRNAEFNIVDGGNADPSIISIHLGTGSAIVGQNQRDNINGDIIVADFAYTGSDGNSDHIAVYGTSNTANNGGDGVVGEGSQYGLRSEGDAHVNGVFTATTKLFYIDHPLDPENQILRHYSMESDKSLNVYQGSVFLNRRGEAVVTMPDYFEAININFTYQLTSVGTPVQPYISQKIENGSFAISGKPGAEVSWMVIANRNDAFVQTHPEVFIPEIDKQPENIGKYLDPVSHGKPKTMGIFYRELKEVQHSGFPELPESTGSVSKADLLEMYGMKDDREESRTSQNILMKQKSELDNARMPISPVQIRQEIKTWDEIH